MNEEIPNRYFRWYAEATGINDKKLRQLKGDIKRGKCIRARDTIIGYGGMLDKCRDLKRDYDDLIEMKRFIRVLVKD